MNMNMNQAIFGQQVEEDPIQDDIGMYFDYSFGADAICKEVGNTFNQLIFDLD